jgi:hypothetical protein
MRDNGDVESESDKLDCKDMPPLENCTEDELTLLIEESMVIRRTLQVQVKKDDSDQQRKNTSIHDAMYKTRCVV